MYICYDFTCLCSSSLRLSLRVGEILGSTPFKGSKYETLLTFAIFTVKDICTLIPGNLTYVPRHQWHTQQHKAASFSIHHTIQQPASHSTRRKFSTYQSIPFQPSLIIATDNCIPLDVNLDPPSGKGMFSEFKSKGWMAEAGSPNVCARQKTTEPGVHNLPSRPGRVAGILRWFPRLVEKYLE